MLRALRLSLAAAAPAPRAHQREFVRRIRGDTSILASGELPPGRPGLDTGSDQASPYTNGRRDARRPHRLEARAPERSLARGRADH